MHCVDCNYAGIEMMRSISWDNYRYVLAIYRNESISGAARSLGVNETTVSRRLAQTEQHLQTKLFIRRSRGLVATDVGQRILERLIRVKAELDQAAPEASDSERKVSGSVTVACDALLLNHIFVPRLPALLLAHPELNCELVSSCDADALKDADIAVSYRLNNRQAACCDQPNHPQNLGQLQLGIFTGCVLEEQRNDEPIPWITLANRTSPFNHFIDTDESPLSSPLMRICADSHDVLLSCVVAGLGKACLPEALGRRDVRLRPTGEKPRDENVELIWRSQPELINTARLNACVHWLTESVQQFEFPA